MIQTVGVVGVGIMGSAMASNLLDTGFEVVGHDVIADRVAALVERGGRAAGSTEEVARASDVIITSLSSSRALDEVTALDGLPAGARPGLVVVETSTLPLPVKEAARKRLEKAGATLVDCPLSGTGTQARTRDLAVYASGDKEAVERCRPVFDAIARVTYYLGPFGTGSKMKFVANLLVSIHNLATAEAFVLAKKAGLDLETVLEVIASGAGTSRIFEVRGPLMASGRYDEPAATIRMFMKDVDVISHFATEVGAPTPLLSATLPYYTAAMSHGRGEEDAAALCAVLESLAATE